MTLLFGRRPRGAGVVTVATMTALLASAIALALDIPSEGIRASAIPWFPAAHLSLSLRIDAFGSFFVVLIAAIGVGVALYSLVYLGGHATAGFYALLLSFTGAMVGIVVSDGLLLLFVFWELTTVTSALLIAGDGTKPAARRGAIQAFLVTGLGGLSLLVALVLLGQIAGTTDLSELATRSDAIVADPRHGIVIALIVLAAATKSAQFPFQFWLAGAMTAPAPISAFLHSATMVNAGVFLLDRIAPALSGSPLWAPLLVVVGGATFVVAGVSALGERDLKALLAYSTAAYLGLMTMAVGVRPIGEGAELSYLNHALYKSSLFLLVGWIEKASHTRDLDEVRRLGTVRRVPIAAALVVVAAAAMASAPLTLGFVAKEAFYTVLLDTGTGATFGRLALILGVAGSALSVAYALRIAQLSFAARNAQAAAVEPRPSRWLLAIPGALLAPQLVAPMIATGRPAIWHAVDALLWLSLATYAAGVALFVFRRVARVFDAVPGPTEAAAALARAIVVGSARVGRATQAGGHPKYLAWSLGVATVTIASAIGASGSVALEWGHEPRASALPAGMIATAIVGALALRGRVAKTIMLAIAGYGTALFYVLFRAPDLALTQVLVETISLVILLFAFRHLPPLARDARTRGTRIAHGLVATVVGATMALLAWVAATAPAPAPVGRELIARSVNEGGGRNAVNVVLVDFRGADTLGEIGVLAIAAFGVLTLLRTVDEAAPR